MILDVVFHGIGTDTGVRPACHQRSATSRDVSWYTCSVSVLFLRENMTEYVFRGGARGRAVSVNLNHHGLCFFEGTILELVVQFIKVMFTCCFCKTRCQLEFTSFSKVRNLFASFRLKLFTTPIN